LSINNPGPGPHFDAFEQPPPPRISSEGIVAQDITERFRSAAAGMSTLSTPKLLLLLDWPDTDRNCHNVTALEPGELVKDGYFTLFESVGALEVSASGRLALLEP
jgi:hypothetical protein